MSSLLSATPVVRPPSPAYRSPERLAPEALPGLPSAPSEKATTVTSTLRRDAQTLTTRAQTRPVPVRPEAAHVKQSLGARFFDGVTDFAGTPYAFTATCVTIGAWAVTGAVLGAPDNWQIAMQDGSSIQCYASDTLLMRQQRNHAQETTAMLGSMLRSNATKARLLPQVLDNPESLRNHASFDRNVSAFAMGVTEGASLPAVGTLDRVADVVSNFAGSPYALGIYGAGIGAWLGLGPMLEFGDEWQLYINTATAVQLTFMAMFLQNTRRRHMHYVQRCAEALQYLDGQLELRLRTAAHDTLPNPPLTVDESVRCATGIRRATDAIGQGFLQGIDGYSNLVASGVGAGVSAAVFATWIGIGSVLKYDSNWWLIIGTYTGLLGFIDGFILRNVHRRQAIAINGMVKKLEHSDRALYQAFNMPFPDPRQPPALRGLAWASDRMSVGLSSPWAVAGALCFVGSLLGIASGMGWSETGQLICNTPTMILEGMLMLVLMQAHNRAHAHKRLGVHDLFERRVQMLARCDEREMAAA